MLILRKQLTNKTPITAFIAIASILFAVNSSYGITMNPNPNNDLTRNQTKEKPETNKIASKLKNPSNFEKLITCTLDNLGVQFSCNPHWNIQDIDENVFVTISTKPSIIMTVAKIDSKIAFTQQISKEFLKSKNLYTEKFDMENVTFAGRTAIKVKAFSKSEPNMRRSDYFLVNDKELYGILFSVYPKESWNDFRFLIKKIEDSMIFIEKSDSEK